MSVHVIFYKFTHYPSNKTLIKLFKIPEKIKSKYINVKMSVLQSKFNTNFRQLNQFCAESSKN